MSDSTTFLAEYLAEQGYENLRQLEDGRIIGTMPMLFTIGLFYGLREYDHDGRYCYPQSTNDVYEAVKSWTGEGDPSGEWIKHKGRGFSRSRLPDPVTGRYED